MFVFLDTDSDPGRIKETLHQLLQRLQSRSLATSSTAKFNSTWEQWTKWCEWLNLPGGYRKTRAITRTNSLCSLPTAGSTGGTPPKWGTLPIPSSRRSLISRGVIGECLATESDFSLRTNLPSPECDVQTHPPAPKARQTSGYSSDELPGVRETAGTGCSSEERRDRGDRRGGGDRELRSGGRREAVHSVHSAVRTLGSSVTNNLTACRPPTSQCTTTRQVMSPTPTATPPTTRSKLLEPLLSPCLVKSVMALSVAKSPRRPAGVNGLLPTRAVTDLIDSRDLSRVWCETPDATCWRRPSYILGCMLRTRRQQARAHSASS